MNVAPPVSSSPAPSWFGQLTGVIRKDLRLEWRGRARINATVFFALLVLLLFSFAMGPDHALLVRTAPGFLWLAIFLASVLSLSESLRVERENDAMEGLRLTPVDPRALFLGKLAVNILFLFGLAVLLVPMAVAIYGVHLKLGFPRIAGVMALGCAAISAPGTLQAAIAIQARARDVLLPLLLFPILVPSLLAAVKATELVMNGDPMGQLLNWSALLGGFAFIYTVACTLLFGKVIE